MMEGGFQEPSEVVLNSKTGERMPLAQYNRTASWTVLRVTDEGEKEEVRLSDAVDEAREQGLKVVVVAANAKPMVVRVMDYGKLMKEKQAQKKIQAKKAKATDTKELRLGFNIGQHDLEVKLKQGREFLEKGHKLKLFTRLKGADFYKGQEQAMEKLRDVASTMTDIAVVEKEPFIQDRNASMLLRPETKPSGGSKKAQPKAPKEGGGGGVGKVKTEGADAESEADVPGEVAVEGRGDTGKEI